MSRPLTAPRPPRGYAFPIADLRTVRHWAERRGIRVDILLDHGRPGEEYEEVLAVSAAGAARPAWRLWRGAEHLVAERADGLVARFVRLEDALAALAP